MGQGKPLDLDQAALYVRDLAEELGPQRSGELLMQLRIAGPLSLRDNKHYNLTGDVLGAIHTSRNAADPMPWSWTTLNEHLVPGHTHKHRKCGWSRTKQEADASLCKALAELGYLVAAIVPPDSPSDG